MWKNYPDIFTLAENPHCAWLGEVYSCDFGSDAYTAHVSENLPSHSNLGHLTANYSQNVAGIPLFKLNQRQ